MGEILVVVEHRQEEVRDITFEMLLRPVNYARNFLIH